MTSLSTKLAELEATGKPIQVGIIGAGKFGSMFISHLRIKPVNRGPPSGVAANCLTLLSCFVMQLWMSSLMFSCPSFFQ